MLKAKEDMQKSPEQLEREKREIIASRLVRLDLNGKLKDDLIKQVKNTEQNTNKTFSVHSCELTLLI